jgi:excisionase family DNA binding protein
MNKTEACAFLGNISERSLARYSAAGKVQVTYIKGKRGNVADYNDQDLERLKSELETSRIRPANERALPAIIDKPDNPAMTGLVQVFDRIAARDEVLITTLQGIQKQQGEVAIEHKLMLTLAEAAALSSLSKQRLREEIKSGTLKAQILGRGWKIKRADLETYIKKL